MKTIKSHFSQMHERELFNVVGGDARGVDYSAEIARTFFLITIATRNTINLIQSSTRHQLNTPVL